MLAKRLRQSVVTRWNSELVMFKSVLESYASLQLLEEFPEVIAIYGLSMFSSFQTQLSRLDLLTSSFSLICKSHGHIKLALHLVRSHCKTLMYRHVIVCLATGGPIPRSGHPE